MHSQNEQQQINQVLAMLEATKTTYNTQSH